MRKLEPSICRRCKKPYIHESGGIIANPEEKDYGLCPECREKSLIVKIKRALGK